MMIRGAPAHPQMPSSKHGGRATPNEDLFVRGRVGRRHTEVWLEAQPAARLLWQRYRVPAGVAEEPGARAPFVTQSCTPLLPGADCWRGGCVTHGHPQTRSGGLGFVEQSSALEPHSFSPLDSLLLNPDK